MVVLALSRLDKTLQWLTYVTMIHHFYYGQDCTQECEWAHGRLMLPLAVLAWETFQETTLANQTKWWYGTRNQFRIPSGLPLVHLHPALVVEP